MRIRRLTGSRIRHVRQALYKARDAAQTWQRKCAGTVQQNRTHDSDSHCAASINGSGAFVGLSIVGDFVFVGTARHLANIAEHTGRKSKVKVITTGNDHKNELRVLSHSIRWAR